MKNLFFTIILLSLITEVKSQLEPAVFSIKGSTGLSSSGNNTTITQNRSDIFSSNESSESKSNNFNFGTSLGYSLSRHVNLGLYLGWYVQKSENDQIKQKYNDFILGPYLRVYMTKFKVNPFINCNFGFERTSMNRTENGSTKELYLGGIRFDYGGGLEYFISKHFSMELFFNRYYSSLYTYEKNNPNEEPKLHYKISGWDLRFGFTILINTLDENTSTF